MAFLNREINVLGVFVDIKSIFFKHSKLNYQLIFTKTIDTELMQKVQFCVFKKK